MARKRKIVTPAAQHIDMDHVLDLEALNGPDSEYIKSSIPLVLPSKRTKAEIMEALPEAPSGKVSSKKLKRLEKFIEKELKKEERKHLLQKLSDSKLNDKTAFHSSKAIGKTQLSLKESLQLALAENRLGIPISSSVDLFVENQVDDQDLEPVEQLPVEPIINEKSLLEQAFESKKENVILVSDGQSLTEETKPLPVKKQFGSALKKTNIEPPKKQIKIVEQPKELGWLSNVEKGEEIKDNIPKELVEFSKMHAKPVEPTLDTSSTAQETSSCPAHYVKVDRREEIQLSRISLPVVAEEQQIMEAVFNNDVIILCGETGSGKTTQVPQFLYEAGFGDPTHTKYKGMVGITQPRRVAAVSMASRVSDEMNLKDGQVAYQIRYDSSTVNSKTRIKFMTDGILLREMSNCTMANDLLLTKYSCIILDEAHERTVGTDVLIGWLTRIAQLRNSGKIQDALPLKIIIMSATLRVEDFVENTSLFPLVKPPVLKVDGRQYKVTIHYNKVTPEVDYLSDIVKKIYKIHTTLPHGAILVFVTGQREIHQVIQKVQEMLSTSNSSHCLTSENQEMGLFDKDFDELNDESEQVDFDQDILNDLQDDEEEQVHVLNGEEGQDAEETPIPSGSKLHILPLYSMLPTEEQMKVFEKPPENSRLCIVATNVAETSLTIPGVRYVIDCGKIKEQVYDETSGSRRFRIQWTSKASADQRAGRAGRVGPGHCYRIFSSSVFQHYFKQFSEPEILKIPIEGVVLQMKAMGINQVVNFPFPTCPDRAALAKAEKLLIHLGALDKNAKITSFGKKMAQLPVSPRFSKMLILASKQSEAILDYLMSIVAGQTVGNLFVSPDQIPTEERKQYHKLMTLFNGTSPCSDLIKELKAIGAFEATKASDLKQFCQDHFMNFKSMQEVSKLKKQLINILSNEKPAKSIGPPTSQQIDLICQLVLAGFPDQVAMLAENGYTSFTSTKNQVLLIHPSSSLYSMKPKFVVYGELRQKEERMDLQDQEALQIRVKNPEVSLFFMKSATIVPAEWLSQLPESLVTNGKMLESPEPVYDYKTESVKCFVSPSFGPKSWQLPLKSIEIQDPLLKCRWFLRLLLGGRIHLNKAMKEANFFKIIQNVLLLKPTAVVKPYGQSNPRISNLVNLFVRNSIHSTGSLLLKLQEKPDFMLNEFLQWIPKDLHQVCLESWPGKFIKKPNEYINIAEKLTKQLVRFDPKKIYHERDSDIDSE